VKGADVFSLFWQKRFVTDQQLNFVELLYLFPSCQPPLDHLLSLLPQLMPRFYSIATSPLADPTTIGIAFTVVDELIGPNTSIRRRGLCTNWLHDICQPQLVSSAPVVIKVPLFLRPTRDFLLPASHEWPLILIGPGTGVAPFMGFLQHRHNEVKKRAQVASQVCSGSWRGGLDLDMEEDDEFVKTPSQAAESKGIYLFYGCRRRADDWIFEDDMKGYQADGTLRQLFTAFSREQEDQKHYVQHELRTQGALVTELLLQSGGYVYVCGDGTQMAKDVHEALRDVLQEHGHLTKEQADEHLATLSARQRYVRDIW
jgi:methionine synthase reductase